MNGGESDFLLSSSEFAHGEGYLTPNCNNIKEHHNMLPPFDQARFILFSISWKNCKMRILGHGFTPRKGVDCDATNLEYGLGGGDEIFENGKVWGKGGRWDLGHLLYEDNANLT